MKLNSALSCDNLSTAEICDKLSQIEIRRCGRKSAIRILFMVNLCN